MNTQMQTFDGNYGEFDVTSLSANTNFLMMAMPDVQMSQDAIFNTVTAPSKPVSDNIGDTFNLVGIIAHPVQVTDQNTGELVPAPRMILLGSEGESYSCVSLTMFSSLKNLFAICGNIDTWSKGGKRVKIRQTSKGEKRYYSLEVLELQAGKPKSAGDTVPPTKA